MEDIRTLIIDNQNLIYSIINKFKVKDKEDLFQAGCMGLIMAYNNYNDCYNTKFTTYAYPYIWGEISKYITNNRSIRLSPSDIRLYKSLTKTKDYLTNRLGRNPTDSEIANFLEIDLYKLYELQNIINISSFDYEYENNDLYDVVSMEKIDKDLLIDLKNALLDLSSEERKLIMERYFNNVTQSEYATNNSLNQVKVSRNEKKILMKLKAKMY